MNHKLIDTLNRAYLLRLNRRQLLTSGALIATVFTIPSTASRALGAASSNADATAIKPIPIPTQVPVAEGVAKLKEVGLWYWDTGGHGTPIILFHPFTGSGRVWPYQQPVFAKAGYRVIGYSRRGFQNSEAGPTDKPGIASEDLHQLLTVLGIDKFHAVASAGGAFVAADYAISHPERIQSLVLACSILGVQDGEFATLLNGLRVPGYESLPAYFRELSPSYRAINPEGTEHWKELESASMPGDRIQQTYANKISLATLEQLKAPTLLICGDADLIAPPPIVRLFAKHIPNSELVVLPECGHSAYWEQPELFNQAVLSFLRRHRA